MQFVLDSKVEAVPVLLTSVLQSFVQSSQSGHPCLPSIEYKYLEPSHTLCSAPRTLPKPPSIPPLYRKTYLLLLAIPLIALAWQKFLTPTTFDFQLQATNMTHGFMDKILHRHDRHHVSSEDSQQPQQQPFQAAGVEEASSSKGKRVVGYFPNWGIYARDYKPVNVSKVSVS